MILGFVSADHAVQAAVSLAASHGVVCVDPVVLRNLSNTVVHLRPAPVVARVAVMTALVRPGIVGNLARDLAVTRFLDERGVPVVPPSAELPAGPHVVDRFVISFSTYVEHDPDWHATPADFAKLLAELHAELRHFDGDLPTRMPLDDTANILAVIARDHPTVDLTDLRTRLADVTRDWESRLGEVQPLHGDAHPGNLLLTAAGPTWIDFEDTWRGPVAWDLACLAATRRIRGIEGVPHYPDKFAHLDYFLDVRRVFVEAFALLLRQHGLL